MKFFRKTAVPVLLLIVMLWASTAQASGLEWMPYAKGMEEGKTAGRKIMVNFWAGWCRYCAKMDSETFADQDVADYLQKNFVSIRVDADTAKELAAMYEVRGLPTTVFLEPNGDVIAPVSGYSPPEQFLPILKYLHTGAYKNMTYPEFMEKQ